jgi:hypothetical protein
VVFTEDFMRKLVRGAWTLGLAVAVAGCASATASTAGISLSAGALGAGNPSVGLAAAAAATPSSAATAGPLGLLPIPAGANAWSVNTNAPMTLVPWIDQFFGAPSQASEKSLYTERKFQSGGFEGWINLDGSQQSIAIARFADANGAISAFDDLSNYLRQKPAPSTVFTVSADGAVGSVDPTLDKDGNAYVDVAARVGDYLVDVHEFSAATADPAAAKAMLLAQLDALKDGS